MLTDVVMPGKNGRILSEKLVRQRLELKVLFMTGYSRDAIVRHGRLDEGVFCCKNQSLKEIWLRGFAPC